MGNIVSVPSKDLEKHPNDMALNTCLFRFYRELQAEEKYHLVMGGCGLIVNALTNMIYPRIIGLLIDSSDLSQIPTLEKCPEYNFPFALSCITGLYRKFDSFNSNSLFNRILLYSLPIYVTGSLASWLRVYHTHTAIYLIQKRYRMAMFKRLLSQNLLFFHSKTSNYLILKLLNDCEDGPRKLVESHMHLLRCSNSTIGGTFHLFSISPILTLVILLSIPLIGVSLRYFSSVVKKCQQRKKNQIDQVMARAEEVLTGIENVVSFAKEDCEVYSFINCLNECDTLAIKANNTDGIMIGSILASFNLSTLIMIYFGSRQMNKGSLTVGKFASFIIYGSLIGLGVSGLSKIYSEIIKGANSMCSIYEITDLKEEEDEYLILEEVKGDLEIRNVSFGYPNRECEVLKDISLKIDGGDIVGVVGPSGAGKTTLCKLLMTIYKPTHGEILLDSNDMGQLSSKWLRSSVFSIVPQEPGLFSMSIEDNIKYGNPKATDEDVAKVSKQCNLDDFIQSLPNKYKTQVGPRGSTLSTGQKQRIALARAILKNSPILILDEPTSSLDGFSEEVVKMTIHLTKNEKTLIIVTHKPEILKLVQKVVVLNKHLEYFGDLEGAKLNSQTFKTIFPTL